MHAEVQPESEYRDGDVRADVASKSSTGLFVLGVLASGVAMCPLVSGVLLVAGGSATYSGIGGFVLSLGLLAFALAVWRARTRRHWLWYGSGAAALFLIGCLVCWYGVVIVGELDSHQVR